MARTQVRCNSCGELAIVHISNVVAGRRITQDLCMACADRRSQSARESASHFRLRMTRSEIGGALIGVGLFVFTVSAFADVLQFGMSEGFGWHQSVGLALAAMLTLTGSLFGVLTLVMIGVFIGSVTLLADFLAFGSNPGFGIQQMIGSTIGAVILAVGFRAVRKPVTRAADASSASGPSPSSGSAQDQSSQTRDR